MTKLSHFLSCSGSESADPLSGRACENKLYRAQFTVLSSQCKSERGSYSDSTDGDRISSSTVCVLIVGGSGGEKPSRRRADAEQTQSRRRADAEQTQTDADRCRADAEQTQSRRGADAEQTQSRQTSGFLELLVVISGCSYVSCSLLTPRELPGCTLKPFYEGLSFRKKSFQIGTISFFLEFLFFNFVGWILAFFAFFL